MCTLEVGDPGERPREEEKEGGGHWVVGAALAAVLMGPEWSGLEESCKSGAALLVLEKIGIRESRI